MSLSATVEKKPKSSAPGQYLGYGLQAVRLCHHLLDVADGYTVSIENIDDLAIRAPDGTLILEQAKSAHTKNPFADRSVELWKTFSNWADLCTIHGLSPSGASFRLYVTPLHSGPLVKKLNDSHSNTEISALLNQISELSAKGKPETGCNPFVLKFLAAGPSSCAEIIRNFSLESEDDPLTGIRKHLHALIDPESLEDFVSAAIGIAKESADKLLREGLPATIDAAAFRKRFRAFVRKNHLRALLRPTTSEPSQPEIQHMMSMAPLFVRQLEAVDASQDMLVVAVSDFLRTNADKTNWAAAGVIVEDSLEELDASLERRFKHARDEIADLHSGMPITQQGRLLYRRCIETSFSLEGEALPAHFVPGAFNCLANTLRVGWHSDYLNLFKDN